MNTKTLSELKTSTLEEWINDAPFLAVDLSRKKGEQKVFVFTGKKPRNLNGTVIKAQCSCRAAKNRVLDGGKQLVNGARYAVKQYDYYIVKP